MTMENHHVQWKNWLFLWPFSIVIFVYPRFIWYSSHNDPIAPLLSTGSSTIWGYVSLPQPERCTLPLRSVAGAPMDRGHHKKGQVACSLILYLHLGAYTESQVHGKQIERSMTSTDEPNRPRDCRKFDLNLVGSQTEVSCYMILASCLKHRAPRHLIHSSLSEFFRLSESSPAHGVLQ